MSCTEQDRLHHGLYELMDSPRKEAVDDAFDKVVAALHDRGFTAANDDRAESLIGAIAWYLLASTEKHLG
jgi:hypothetical protein